MKSAKEEIFDRIRRANKGVVAQTQRSEYEGIERRYRQESSIPQAAVIDLFIDRLHDYGSGVFRCSQGDIATTVGSILRERAIEEMLVSREIPTAWLPGDVVFREDHNLSYETIDGQRGVLTGCAVAIAVTGTIIVHHRSDRRALTLIPDFHLCVVFEQQVVETVPEAMRQISAFGNAPLTTISGPSATADIEMTRIKGVHGPRLLDVVLVASLEPVLAD
jgi:L-lactate dehydrogenase complex protein LldG